MQLNLYPSKYFLAFILLSHISAMLIILALPMQWWAMVIVEALLGGSFVHMVQKYVTRKLPTSIIALWQQEKNWILLDRAGNKLVANLLKDSTSTSILVVLNFKLLTGKKVSVLLFSDSIDKLHYSKLRSYLKTQIR